MFNGIQTGARAMSGLMAKQEIIANNLANTGTDGFKKDGTIFSALLQGKLNGPPAMEVFTNAQQGALQATGNPLDVAISGPGYFVVQTEQGLRYTRNGGFQMGASGAVTDKSGNPVLSENGPISIDPKEVGTIAIDAHGNVTVGSISLGRLQIRDFELGSELKKGGDGLVELVQGNAVGSASMVSQGFREASNADSVTEMVEMMDTLRLFELNQKSMRMQDEALSRAINQLG